MGEKVLSILFIITLVALFLAIIALILVSGPCQGDSRAPVLHHQGASQEKGPDPLLNPFNPFSPLNPTNPINPFINPASPAPTNPLNQ